MKEDESPLFDLDDKELIKFAHKTRNNLIMDTVAPEMMRRLKRSIDTFNQQSSRYSKIIIRLTIVLGILAIIQIIIAYLTFFTNGT